MKKNISLAVVLITGLLANAFADQQQMADGLQNQAIKLGGQATKLKQIANNLAASGIAAASSVAEAATLADQATRSAEDAAAKAASTPADNNEWTGNHLQIRGNLPGLKKEPDDGKAYFAPAFVRFDVSKENADGTIVITPRDNFRVNGNVVDVHPWVEHNLYGLIASPWSPVKVTTPAGATPIQVYDTYVVSKKKVENVPYVTYGWTYGALIVPFKYQKGYKTIVNSTSFEMYLGYKRDTNGDDEGPFVHAGLGNADIPTGAGTSTSKQGVSYGLGWLFEVKKGSGIQLMLMTGWDRFGGSSGYQYEGNQWYSITLGFALGQKTAQ